MYLRNFLLGCLFLALLAGTGLLLGLRSYQVFTQQELVALVALELAPEGSGYSFQLFLTPVIRGIPGEPKGYPMQGEQWAIGGDILKMHPWVNLWGLKNRHKLTRLSSRYLKADKELKAPRSAYDLNGGTDLLWRCLYRVGRWIPLVEAVYGNAAYTMAQPATQWGVYVTLSGYLVKPQRIK